MRLRLGDCLMTMYEKPAFVLGWHSYVTVCLLCFLTNICVMLFGVELVHFIAPDDADLLLLVLTRLLRIDHKHQAYR